MDYLGPFLGSEASITSNRWGRLKVEAASFTPAVDGDMVIHVGEPLAQSSPLVRIHSECVLGELLDSDLCDCKEQFVLAMERLIAEGHGCLFYLRFDGRGAGLAAKICATALEVDGMDTYDSRVAIGVSPEGRDFGKVGIYLRERGVKQIRLLTNSPIKELAISGVGIDVVREPLVVSKPSEKVRRLLETKASKFSHHIDALPDE
jgi:GTP cyclohydrolase II